MRRALVAAVILAALVAATGLQAAEEQATGATVMVTDGRVYQGRVLSLDDAALKLVTDSGRSVTLTRKEVAFVNFRPDWLAVKAFGTRENTFYDFGSGYVLPLPSDGWQTSQDSEGHLFLHKGKATIGVYAYLSRYSTLNVFLSVHASWRQSQEMPRESYVDGVEMTIDGLPAKAFAFETETGGQAARLLDIKVVGPLGHGYVIAVAALDASEEEFEAAKREAMPIIGKLRFVRPVS